MATAKLFRDGRSQAVRLPKEFRFESEEVLVRRDGDAVILEPMKPRSWPKGYWRRWGRATRDLELIEAPAAPQGSTGPEPIRCERGPTDNVAGPLRRARRNRGSRR